MTKKLIKEVLRSVGVEIQRHDRDLDRFKSLHQKYNQFTMISESAFILNLDVCNRHRNTAGDYVECGVWRGGMSAAIAEVLGSDRRVHLFDSFQGLPAATDSDGEKALAWQQAPASQNYENCRTEESYVLRAMELAGHENFETYPGWFDATVPQFGDHSVAILRLDGDWYDSIMVCLNHLFPKVVKSGIVLLDDYYYWDGCAKAVHDYLSKTKSSSRVYQWNNQLAYLVKE